VGFFTKDTGHPRTARPTGKAARRVQHLPTPDLVPWAETCLYTVGRYLNEYAKTGDETALAEATMAAETLQVVMDEINVRDASPGGH
jgi:hypothetical protein